MLEVQRVSIKVAATIVGGVAGFGLGLFAGPVILSGIFAYHGWKQGDLVCDLVELKQERSREADPLSV